MEVIPSLNLSIPLEKAIAIIEEIRTTDKTNKQIADEYGEDPSTISRARYGKTWSKVFADYDKIIKNYK